MQVITDERESNRFVAGLGARKMWLRLRSKDHDVARCTVERLMGQMGVAGVTRQQRRVRTTIADPAAARPCDLVDRHFAASTPNQLWVADFTYCPTWDGMVYVAFVFDVFSRRVLGWRAAISMTTPLVLDCLEQAIWTRKTRRCQRPVRAGASHRCRQPIHLDRVHRPARRGRHRPLGRIRSATPTTTPWPSPRSACSSPSSSGPTDPGATVDHLESSRTRLGHLVQHRATPRIHRGSSTGGRGGHPRPVSRVGAKLPGRLGAEVARALARTIRCGCGGEGT